MKKLLLSILLLLFLLTSLLADELSIPYPCYPKLLVKEFAKYNMKLELRPEKRDKKSWGYLENKGGAYTIYTYHSITKEELRIVSKIVRDIEKEQSKKWNKEKKRDG